MYAFDVKLESGAASSFSKYLQTKLASPLASFSPAGLDRIVYSYPLSLSVVSLLLKQENISEKAVSDLLLVVLKEAESSFYWRAGLSSFAVYCTFPSVLQKLYMESKTGRAVESNFRKALCSNPSCPLDILFSELDNAEFSEIRALSFFASKRHDLNDEWAFAFLDHPRFDQYYAQNFARSAAPGLTDDFFKYIYKNYAPSSYSKHRSPFFSMLENPHVSSALLLEWYEKEQILSKEALAEHLSRNTNLCNELFNKIHAVASVVLDVEILCNLAENPALPENIAWSLYSYLAIDTNFVDLADCLGHNPSVSFALLSELRFSNLSDANFSRIKSVLSKKESEVLMAFCQSDTLLIKDVLSISSLV